MKFSTLTRFAVGQNHEVREGCVFFVLRLITVQAAHGIGKLNIEPRMASFNENFNPLTFSGGSKS